MNTIKRALITGIAGQDGSYLAEFLLNKNYEVHGLIKTPHDDTWRIRHIIDKIVLHYGDVGEYSVVQRLIGEIQPHEVYHGAAKVDARVMCDDEFDIFRTNLDSVHYFLTTLRDLKPDCKFYFPGSSHMFGRASSSPQNEDTPFNPGSPYGIAKTAAFYLVKMYRESYHLFASSAILLNHESPRRDQEFLPRKITIAAARIKAGLEKELRLGNIEVKRDWGFAGDFVEAMWLMLQQEKPDDYVIGTGESHSVREFLEIAFGLLNLDWKKYVIFDQQLIRPEEPSELVADFAKAKRNLGWQPKTSFHDLVKLMVDADSKIINRQQL